MGFLAEIIMKIKDVDLVVIHCSATREGQDVRREDIKGMHLKRGFNDVGYHIIIYLDGTVVKGRDLDVMGAHVEGFNRNSWGICYIGGLDKDGKPKDTRTLAQNHSLKQVIEVLKVLAPKAEVKGHRDLSPDKNKDGVIDKVDWLKMCPCFDVEKWVKPFL